MDTLLPYLEIANKYIIMLKRENAVLMEFKRKSLELALAVRKHEKERMIVDKKYAWVLARELLEIEESLND